MKQGQAKGSVRSAFAQKEFWVWDQELSARGTCDCYLENRSPRHKGWGWRLAWLNYIHNRKRRCACGKTHKSWDCFAFLLAGCSDFPLVCWHLAYWHEKILVCGVSLSPGQRVCKRARSSSMWQLDTSIVLMRMCVLVIPNCRNIKSFAPFLQVSTVLAMLGKKEEMIPLADKVPGTETGRGSPQAHWPAWQCCRDAWQVNLQVSWVSAMAWLGCWLTQDGQGTEQSGSEQLYSEQHLLLMARGCCSWSCPGHQQDCGVEYIPVSSISSVSRMKIF